MYNVRMALRLLLVYIVVPANDVCSRSRFSLFAHRTLRAALSHRYDSGTDTYLYVCVLTLSRVLACAAYNINVSLCAIYLTRLLTLHCLILFLSLFIYFTFIKSLNFPNFSLHKASVSMSAIFSSESTLIILINFAFTHSFT